MKKPLLLLTVCAFLPLFAQAQDDNEMFLRALHDEMARTQKELRTAGSPAPFFIGYDLLDASSVSATAQFGQTVVFPRVDRSVLASVLMSVGNQKTDNWGLDNTRVVAYNSAVPRSYYGVRQSLWELSDMVYAKAIQLYDAKAAFKRNKNITSNLPDFLPAKKIGYLRALTEPDLMQAEQTEQLARELSDWGKDKKFVENFTVSVSHVHHDIYYVNSEGSSYRDSQPQFLVTWSARMRNKAGYVNTFSKEEHFLRPDAQTLEEIRQLSAEFRTQIENAYDAKKADESYIGPVLLEPNASAWLFEQVFIPQITNLKPLLDTTAQNGGNFRDKLGKRVMSNLVSVYDRPQVHAYKNRPLYFRGYFDDEGVPAQNITLVQNGKLKELPRSRRPLDKNAKSNGHAFASPATLSFPREKTTNVWVEALRPQTPEQLEQQLLAKCRDMEMEYCYIVKTLPEPVAERIYTSDGHKETVFGLRVSGVTTRALRDIIGAGNDYEVTGGGRFITPSLLVEELEFVPITDEPEKAPFVPKP